MAEIINTNLDTTPLPPNNLVAQDPQSAELAGYVRTKTFGRDVRESIARSIELNSTRSKSAEELANETVNVANDLTERFNAQIGAFTEDSEVIDARNGFPTLRDRLNLDSDKVKRNTLGWVNVLNEYDIDLAVNATEKINQAITNLGETGGTLYFENGIYLIDPSVGIELKSNITFEFDSNVEFKSTPSSAGGYELIRILDCENIKINGRFKLTGDRLDHLGTTGEWGMGISIKGATNVEINGAVITDCWGDGIYIGQTELNKLCQNIKINNSLIDNNRRQGISVISVDGLSINDTLITRTNGAAPESAIDIEPNSTDAILRNITINNLVTEDNNGGGFEINFVSYRNTPNNVDVRVNNFKSNRDGYGIYVREGGNISGDIQIDRPVISNSLNIGIALDNYSSTNPHLKIVQPKVVNSSTRPKSTISAVDDAGIRVYRSASATPEQVEPIGNITIINPSVLDNRTPKQTGSGILIRDLRDNNIAEVKIIDPIQLEASDGRKLSVSAYPTKDISDNFDVFTKYVGTNTTLQSIDFAKKIVNTSDTTVTATIQQLKTGTQLEFINQGTGSTVVRTLKLLGVNTTTDYVVLRGRGSRLLMEKVDDSEENERAWRVVSVFGDLKDS